MKRRQDSGDEDQEWSPGCTIDSGEYRTAKRRRKISQPDSESSVSSGSDSDHEGSDAKSSESVSSWGSWGSDSGSSSELPAEKQDMSDIESPTKEDYEKLRNEETSVFEDLDHFWTSQIAAKARKEFGTSKIYRGEGFSSPEIIKKRCGEVERLMGLPCVLSVGFNKEHSKFTVAVSDRNKAMELTENLANQNIDIVEVRSSHLL